MEIPFGISEEIGFRRTMEDEHAVYQDPARSFFSAEIYDGHGGRQPAQIAAEMLTPWFLHALAREPERPPGERRDEAAILREAYLAVDEHLVGRRVQAGTCAVQLYLIGERFLAANVGDSRVVIGTGQGATVLTEDHKPDATAERSRVEALGGSVVMLGVPRVEGILAVSRALGDVCLKPYVSAEPRIAEGVLGSENDVAVLACDGVWDVLSPGEVIEAARQGRVPREGAEEISHKALDRGSTDNITVIVLDLRGYTSTLKNRKMVIQRVYDRELRT
ncbi:MAG: Protein phosphatase 2C [Syntrophorhabdus sp. PtaB.Bin184]|nr:MAG: Protein phosphatase 2C [Syntrophorhabdus sp. PtaB.Bin184]